MISTGSTITNSDVATKVEENNSVESTTSTGGNGSGATGAWGENKLSDVVKGVAKSKNGSNNGHGPKHLMNGPALIPSGGGHVANSSAAVAASGAATAVASKATSVESQTSPMPNGDLAQSTLALTPPTSPGKKEKLFATSTIANSSKTAKTPSSQSHHQQQHPAGAPSEGVPAKVVVASVPPPGVSYAKMAEQNKDRLEQMAREVKERELEQERERRRVAQTSMSSHYDV